MPQQCANTHMQTQTLARSNTRTSTHAHTHTRRNCGHMIHRIICSLILFGSAALFCRKDVQSAQKCNLSQRKLLLSIISNETQVSQNGIYCRVSIKGCHPESFLSICGYMLLNSRHFSESQLSSEQAAGHVNGQGRSGNHQSAVHLWEIINLTSL